MAAAAVQLSERDFTILDNYIRITVWKLCRSYPQGVRHYWDCVQFTWLETWRNLVAYFKPELGFKPLTFCKQKVKWCVPLYFRMQKLIPWRDTGAVPKYVSLRTKVKIGRREVPLCACLAEAARA